MKNESPTPPASTNAEKREQAPAKAAPMRGRPTLSDLLAMSDEPAATAAWKHAAAGSLHGWNSDEGKGLRMTPDVYAEALKAAALPNARGHYEPHLPACVATLAKRLTEEAEETKKIEEAREKAAVARARAREARRAV